MEKTDLENQTSESLDIDEEIGLSNEELNDITSGLDITEIDDLKDDDISDKEIEVLDMEDFDNKSKAEKNSLEEGWSEEQVASAPSTQDIEDEEINQAELLDDFEVDKPVSLTDEEVNSLENKMDQINDSVTEVHQEDGADEDEKLGDEKIVKLSDHQMDNLLDKVDSPPESSSKKTPTNKKRTKSKNKTADIYDDFKLDDGTTRELLIFLDKLLGSIPQTKIEEFINSKHYANYIKLMSYLKKEN